MSAAGTLSVQQQACARPTLIFVVGWFLPEVRELFCKCGENLFNWYFIAIKQYSTLLHKTHETYNKHDTGWAKGAQSEDHTAPPSSRTASDGRLVACWGGAPAGVFWFVLLTSSGMFLFSSVSHARVTTHRER